MARRKKQQEETATLTVVEGGKDADKVETGDTDNSGTTNSDPVVDVGSVGEPDGSEARMLLHGEGAAVDPAAGDSTEDVPANGTTDADAAEVEQQPDSGNVIADTTPYKRWQPDGATLRNEVARRIAERKRIAREAANIALFPFTDEDGHKEFDKKIKEKRKEYQDACYMIDYDLARYMRAFELACMELAVGSSGDLAALLNGLFVLADSQIPLDDRARQKLEEQRDKEHQEAERAEKARKKAEEDERKARGEVEGQIKLKFDDGSTAEAASECVTRPLVEGEDVGVSNNMAGIHPAAVGEDAQQSADATSGYVGDNRNNTDVHSGADIQQDSEEGLICTDGPCDVLPPLEGCTDLACAHPEDCQELENDHALAMEAEEAARAEAMEANAAGQGALYQDEPLEMEF